jgi:hypothetical protein
MIYTLGRLDNYHFFSQGNTFTDPKELIDFYNTTDGTADIVESFDLSCDNRRFVPIKQFIRQFKLKQL